MKTRLFVLGLLMSLTLGVSARVFDAGERLYINMEALSVKDAGGDLQYGWYSTTNNYNYAYFFKGSKNAWSSQVKQYKGTVWYVEAPAGDWEYVVLTRHNSAKPNWDTKITQTGNIWFYYMDGSTKKMRDQNYIQNFYYGSDKQEANWEYVAPAPSGNPSTWEYEDEQICTDAAGTQYMLQAKNYDYDNTYAHAWFKYESNTWTRLDGAEWRTSEGDKVYEVTLGGVNSDVYYFLQTSRPSMCRLLRVRINQDCSEGAPGACKITSFVAVATEANVTDKKTTLNGVVAFDDKKNAGKLQIWCPGIDTVTIDNKDIETPQTFKLHGFDASSSKTYTLYAKFLSGEGCDATCKVTVTPPSATPTEHTTTGTATDERLVRFTEEDVTLTPDEQSSTYFMWTNTADKDTVTTGARNHTFTAPADEQQVTYYFLATNDPPAPEGNLITNGTFEDPSLDNKLESNYDFWGRGHTDYYKSHKNASGGYAITDNANIFWHEFQHVTAHEGTYFGLFDSKIYDGTDQAAWIARSGDKNPKLKVQKGVSYLFSFWVANINAYYQMNNGARLQFQISYDGGSTWNNLGKEINLGNYLDSRWHGMSSIVTPTVSSTNVVLRVINNNPSDKNIGNDFALDDIRFEAITANSSYIAGYESFPVTYLKCVINSATFEQRQPTGCGTTVADVDFTVNFTHPRGDLYIYEGTTLLAQIPHSKIGDETTSYTGVLPNQPVDNKDHEITVYFDDGNVKTDAPKTYIYNAKAVPAISVESLSWGTVACDVPTVTLTAVINYTNQNGTLTADVDGHPANTASYTVESDDALQVTLVIPGIAADGLSSHLLNVNFDGSHGCSIVNYAIPEAAPVMPAIEAKNFQSSDPRPTCDLTTTLSFDLDYTYQQGKLTYWVDDLSAKTATFTPQDKNKQTLTGLTFEGIPADGKNNHVLHVSFDGPNSCVKDFALPAVPFSPVIDAMQIVSTSPKVTNPAVSDTLACSTNSYTVDLSVTLHFDPKGLNQNIQLDYNDGQAPQTKTVPATGKTTTITGLDLYNIDDTTSLHAIYAVLAGSVPACQESVTYRAPIRAHVHPLFDVTVGQTACDVMNYSLSGTVLFDKADGDLVVSFLDGSKSQTITVPVGSHSADFLFNGLDSVGTGIELKARFTGSATAACEALSKPFDSPVMPKTDTLNVTFGPLSCTDVTATLSFDLDYTYQQGKLTYWVDDLSAKTAAFTPLDKNKQTLTGLTFEGIPADGKNNHVLHVSFDGPNSCVKDYALPAVPFSPVIDAVNIAAVPTIVPCDAKEYTITVSFTSHYGPVPSDKKIVLTYDSLCETKTTSPIALTEFPYNLTIYNIANGIHSVFVAFDDAPDCKKEATYISPARETCVRDSATICEGESYTWHEKEYSGPVGEHGYKDGTDSLYLFVKEKPTITTSAINMTCDDVKIVRVPFSVVKGHPDNFDVEISGSHYAGSLDIVGTDTAFAFTPTALEAGDYAAHVTVGETDVPCTSAVDIRFTLALSGQMYSKWTDVLFIGNKGGRFTAYQWFADGVALSGETLQRLYDPNGLSGSTILYHCRLTTSDGKTLYTCPQAFDDVTPSRTVDTTPDKVKATTLYDTMGRVIKGTPHNGIYIIVEELEDGEIRSRKISVYE